MHLKIEDIRKCISRIYEWLTRDDNVTFISNNDFTTEKCLEISYKLDKSTNKSRILVNHLSESLEDMEVGRQNLRMAVEEEKIRRKNGFFEKREFGIQKDE